MVGELRLLGQATALQLHADHPIGLDFRHPAIHGDAYTGEKLTLIDCTRTNASSGGPPGEPQRYSAKVSPDFVAIGSQHFSPVERCICRIHFSTAIADLIELFQSRKARYTAASTAEDFEWAYRAAIGARQTDTVLRVEIPAGRAPSMMERVDTGFTNGRERIQADNIGWVIEREGRAGKVLLFANTVHLTATPLVARFIPVDGGDARPASKTRT